MDWYAELLTLRHRKIDLGLGVGNPESTGISGLRVLQKLADSIEKFLTLYASI
jgi:hypothetical protein